MSVMVIDFQPCCPNCYGEDFQPVELAPDLVEWETKTVRIERRANAECGHSYIAKCFPYNGEELLHCNLCGTVFERSAAVELKVLEPIQS